jgi:hypothetical protein
MYQVLDIIIYKNQHLLIKLKQLYLKNRKDYYIILLHLLELDNIILPKIYIRVKVLQFQKLESLLVIILIIIIILFINKEVIQLKYVYIYT